MSTTHYESIVFNGNGLNCISTLGALQCALHKSLVDTRDINNFYGTSSGAIICVLLWAGYSPDEILAHILYNDPVSKIRSSFNLLRTIAATDMGGGGMFDISHIGSLLENLLRYKGIDPHVTFDQLTDRHIVIPIYNVDAGVGEYASRHYRGGRMQIVEAVLASCSVPLIVGSYRAKSVDGTRFLDGGLFNNFAIDQTCGKTFGLMVRNGNRRYDSSNTLDTIRRVFHTFVSTNSQLRVDMAKLKYGDNTTTAVVDVDDHFFDVVNINTRSKIIEMFADGYEACKTAKIY